MKRVLVVTENAYLGQKIKLAVLDRAEVTVDREYISGYDICLWDTDSSGVPRADAVTMSRDEPCDLKIPFSREALIGYILEQKVGGISLTGRICEIRGKKIKLTELEARLLALLLEAKGGFVSREEILREIWDNGADAGVINVYVHYLREKIEQGEKIIISSRNNGYKIDGKYLTEAENA